MIQTDNKESYYAAFLYLVWPFFAAVTAFLNYKKPWAKNIVWAFIAFYGFTFSIGEESGRNDIVRYVASYQELHQVQMSPAEAVENFLETSQFDILNTTIRYTLSRFTDLQEMLTLVYAIIFGFFFSRNIWYVLERLKGPLLPITLLLLACLFFIIPIWRINGFRMWTAAHVFIYGLLPYLCEGRKDRLWASFSAILVHFSFIIPLSVLFAYMAAGNRMVLYFSFFVLTFFISEINLSVINQYVETYTPERFQERTETYREVEDDLGGIETAEGGPRLNWYVIWYMRGLKWALMGFIITLFFSGRKFIQTDLGFSNLFSFTLLFFGVANLISPLPSLDRFMTIAYFIAMVLMIFYIQIRYEEKVMKRLVLCTLPALLLFIVVSIRVGIYSMSATSILGNPVIALFTVGENMSLNDFMRLFL